MGPQISICKQIAAALVLVGMPLVAYQPCLEGDFIWDDDKYVSQNRNLRNVDGLVRSWTDAHSTEGAQYYPLVYTTFWLEYQAWGLDSYGYHRDNVLLHGFCAVLFWLILRRVGVSGAFFAASLFALHPVCVESVAWITERKNVLSMFFGAASLFAYLSFVRWECGGLDRDREPLSWAAYATSLVLFACALLSKTVVGTLPAVIILLFWYAGKKVTGTIALSLVPYFVLSVLLALVTVATEGDHMGTECMPFFQDLHFMERLIVAGNAVWFYMGKIAWPTELSFIYPQWKPAVTSSLSYVPLAGAVILPGVLWMLRRRIGRGPLAGILLYLGVVSPALGFFDIAQMRFSYVADHWVYHASTGLFALFAAGAVMGVGRLRRIIPSCGAAAPVVAVALLATLGGMTWRQCQIYQGLEPLWRDVVEKNPEAWIAHVNLGILLARGGEIEKSMPHLEKAIQLDPDHYRSCHAMGNALLGLGRADEAIPHYRRALEIRPHYEGALGNLGLALESLGRTDEAKALYEQATRAEANAFAAVGHYHLGLVLQKGGNGEEARVQFVKSLDRAPHFTRPRRALTKMDTP